MKRILFISIIVALSVQIAYSCTCKDKGHLAEFRDAAAVFAGEVVEIKEDTTYRPPKLFPSPHLQKLVDSTKRYVVRFKVLEHFKGSFKTNMTLSSYLSSVCSGLSFTEGKKYLVYASREKDEVVSGYLCSRTRMLDKRSKDYKQLKSFWFRMRARI